MDVKKKLQAGWLHVLVTFEIIGTPKTHVEETLRKYLDAIKKREDIEWLEENIGEPEATDNYFSSFAEVDMLVKNIDTLAILAVEYTPASVEVIEPAKFEFTALDLQNMMNDVLSKLHVIGMAHKEQAANFEVLRKQFQLLVNNIIILSLAKGPKKLADIAKETSLIEQAVKGVLKKLVEAKKVKEKKGVYSLK